HRGVVGAGVPVVLVAGLRLEGRRAGSDARGTGAGAPVGRVRERSGLLRRGWGLGHEGLCVGGRRSIGDGARSTSVPLDGRAADPGAMLQVCSPIIAERTGADGRLWTTRVEAPGTLENKPKVE